MSNTGLGHDGDGDGLHDILDHAGVRHARHATLGSDVGGDSLEGHDGGSTGFFSDPGLHAGIRLCDGQIPVGAPYLLGIDHIHDHPALQHLGETGLDSKGVGSSPVRGTILLRSHDR